MDNPKKIKSIILILSLFFFANLSVCQTQNIWRQQNFGFAATSMISANGYGGQCSPMLYFKKGRRSYFIGPLIQCEQYNLSGVQINFDYMLAGKDAPGNEADDKDLELFCFVTTAYSNKALLGKRALREETLTNKNYEGDVCKLYFSSVEVYGGIGLKFELLKNLKWINYIGVGGYSSFNFPSHLNYEPYNLGLILKTGISLDLRY